MAVEELLEIRLGPCLVKPAAWVGSSLSSLLGDVVVLSAKLREKTVALSWLWYRDVVIISESLER